MMADPSLDACFCRSKDDKKLGLMQKNVYKSLKIRNNFIMKNISNENFELINFKSFCFEVRFKARS